jgi:hypothetical protein
MDDNLDELSPVQLASPTSHNQSDFMRKKKRDNDNSFDSNKHQKKQAELKPIMQQPSP